MSDEKKDFDAVVVGSGPNGLAAAILMQQQGLSVLLVEGNERVGGGLRTKELTLPGFRHDVCSAIHPLAMVSPFMSKLPLKQFGADFILPTLAAAHPFDNGTAAVLDNSLENTARLMGKDGRNYEHLINPIVRNWHLLVDQLLGPFSIPKHPIALTNFGLKALMPARLLATNFSTREARGLFAGMAAHSVLPLSHPATSAIALVLMTAAHIKGWPFPKGGSQAIADAMEQYFRSLGGQVQTGTYITSLEQLPSSKAVLFDVNPAQLLRIAGHKFSSLYRWQLNRFIHGPGSFKIDWAMAEPAPFTAEMARLAGTVHLGNTLSEIARSEYDAWHGKHSEKPFVLYAQQSSFDPTRAPEGKHVAWGYCHVPKGSVTDMTRQIEDQVERFAPGFKDRILARHVMRAVDLENYNPNYVGGDIGGGALLLSQLFTRPALRYSPYRTSAKGLYICSSSTPPGGGVHGMCGYHAAKRALKDIFHINVQ